MLSVDCALYRAISDCLLFIQSMIEIMRMLMKYFSYSYIFIQNPSVGRYNAKYTSKLILHNND